MKFQNAILTALTALGLSATFASGVAQAQTSPVFPSKNRYPGHPVYRWQRQ